MREHIELTIRDLQESVDHGLQLIERLKRFGEELGDFGSAAEQSPAPARALRPEPIGKTRVAHVEDAGPEKRDGKKRVAPLNEKKQTHRPPVVNGLGKRVLAVMAKMPEPFDFKEVHAALGDRLVSFDQVRGAVAYALKKGQVICVVEGNLGRPGKVRLSAAAKKAFAGGPPRAVAGPRDKQPPTSKPLSKRDELQAQMDKECKLRDEARARGLENVEQVHQREIDRLLVQLGDMK